MSDKILDSPKRRIAAVFAHPDDEILACGGAMASHARAGVDVHILILTGGLDARSPATMSERSGLMAASAAAARLLGAREPRNASFPDNSMDALPLLDVIKVVESFIEDVDPDLIYTQHGGDLNLDHRICHQAVVTACRPAGHRAPDILCGEVLSSTEWASTALAPFVPQVFVPLSEEVLQQKLAAVDAYATEMRPFPHPRSREAVKAQAVLRGAQSGVPAAEAFSPVRMVLNPRGTT